MYLWWAGMCLEVTVGSELQATCGRWCWVPTLSVVWPGAFWHWSLNAVVWGQVSVPKQQPLGEQTRYALGLYHQCPSPYSELQLTPTSPGRHPWGRQVNSVPGAQWSHCFALVPSAHETLCAPSKSGVSVPLVLWNSCSQAPLAFKSQMLLFPMSDPQAGEPDMGLRTLNRVGESPWQEWDLIISRNCPSYHLTVAFLSSEVEYLFW